MSTKTGCEPRHWTLYGDASFSMRSSASAAGVKLELEERGVPSIENGHSYGYETNGTRSWLSAAAHSPAASTRRRSSTAPLRTRQRECAARRVATEEVTRRKSLPVGDARDRQATQNRPSPVKTRPSQSRNDPASGEKLSEAGAPRSMRKTRLIGPSRAGPRPRPPPNHPRAPAGGDSLRPDRGTRASPEDSQKSDSFKHASENSTDPRVSLSFLGRQIPSGDPTRAK